MGPSTPQLATPMSNCIHRLFFNGSDQLWSNSSKTENVTVPMNYMIHLVENVAGKSLCLSSLQKFLVDPTGSWLDLQLS